jgi:hypothetical protein
VGQDYTFQIPSEHNASIHMGKPPHFDGMGYNQWKTKIFGYLSAIHKDLWKIVEVRCDIPDDDETPSPLQAYILQHNFRNLSKNKYESRRRSSKPCFGCKKIGHFITECPEEKKKNKDTKESSSKRDKPRYKTRAGEAHLGQ